MRKKRFATREYKKRSQKYDFRLSVGRRAATVILKHVITAFHVFPYSVANYCINWEIEQTSPSRCASPRLSTFILKAVFPVLGMWLVNVSNLPADIMKCVSAVKQSSTKVMSLTQQKEGL